MAKLIRVTVTGADDSTDPRAMVNLAEIYPFVEWGILVSANLPTNRFPSVDWLQKLKDIKECFPELNLSCHVCGKWVKDICFSGIVSAYLQGILQIFQRVQLNFHAIAHQVNEAAFVDFLQRYNDKQIILQLDGVNDHLMDIVHKHQLNAVPLFDRSGGIGVLPEEWIKAGGYQGYAGGLSPDNLTEQMPKIIAAAGDNDFWIDAETHLRSDNDKVFDLFKVHRFLSIAQKFMTR